MMRRVKVRPLIVSVCALAALSLAAPIAHAQSQGVGLTVEAPVQSTASPAASPSGSDGGGTVPASSSGDDTGTVVQGTTITPPNGTGRPLPRTGMDVLRLLAIALGLVTLGQVMVRAVRRAPA